MSEPIRDSIKDLAAAYAIGALDAEEARAFESLLEESEESRLRRRERARDRVIEKFSLEVAVEKFERLYNGES